MGKCEGNKNFLVRGACEDEKYWSDFFSLVKGRRHEYGDHETVDKIYKIFDETKYAKYKICENKNQIVAIKKCSRIFKNFFIKLQGEIEEHLKAIKLKGRGSVWNRYDHSIEPSTDETVHLKMSDGLQCTHSQQAIDSSGNRKCAEYAICPV